MEVLIVDDEKMHADVVAEYKSLNGIKSTILHSENTAIDWLTKNDCNSVITDIKMLNGTGIDLMKWIIDENSQTPIIAISADGSSHETEQFCEVMKIPFLSKKLEL
ncbi:MAG: response regulator [Lentisphaerales bacterium]|nr:response regulator [Lentisphaerales bacterium]